MPVKNDFLEIAQSLSKTHPELSRAFNTLGRRKDYAEELPTYTVATLPDADARKVIYVSDGTSNKRIAVGDGTNFRFPDGNIVS